MWPDSDKYVTNLFSYIITRSTLTNELSIHKTPAVSPITEAPLDLALRCDLSECELPYCYCSKDGTNIPRDLSAEDVSSDDKSFRSTELSSSRRKNEINP